MPVFLMSVRVTHCTHDLKRVGFFLSINREKIWLFPSDFMLVKSKLIKTQNSQSNSFNIAHLSKIVVNLIFISFTGPT